MGLPGKEGSQSYVAPLDPVLLDGACGEQAGQKVRVSLTQKTKSDETLIQIVVNTGGQVIRITDNLGNTMPHIFAYWFA